jgi:hypothetical protein
LQSSRRPLLTNRSAFSEIKKPGLAAGLFLCSGQDHFATRGLQVSARTFANASEVFLEYLVIWKLPSVADCLIGIAACRHDFWLAHGHDWQRIHRA